MRQTWQAHTQGVDLVRHVREHRDDHEGNVAAAKAALGEAGDHPLAAHYLAGLEAAQKDAAYERAMRTTPCTLSRAPGSGRSPSSWRSMVLRRERLEASNQRMQPTGLAPGG